MSYTILKFGGTSLGTPERVKYVYDIIKKVSGKKFIVLSAVSGTTNTLEKYHHHCRDNKLYDAKNTIEELYKSYVTFAEGLIEDKEFFVKAIEVIDDKFNLLRTYLNKKHIDTYEKKILAQGELLSTHLFELYLLSINKPCKLLSALDFMRLTPEGEPNLEIIEHDLNMLLKTVSEDIIITQGFICRNHKGGINNLQRGGSDYSASLIGAAVKANEVQIWTDIDGMHNNDPRVVKKTIPVGNISFDEASELSYFGAKILHPSCIIPAQKYNIPVKILNTLQPDSKGTVISENTSSLPVKAIAAKDGIVAIRIKSYRMVLAYGFIRKVFEVFERYKTSVDMITTSEIAISCTIDDTTYLQNIITDLKPYGEITVDKNTTIIAVVGKDIVKNKEYVHKTFNTLNGLPVRMVSFGGSKNNISVLIRSSAKKEIMEKLNKSLFNL